MLPIYNVNREYSKCQRNRKKSLKKTKKGVDILGKAVIIPNVADTTENPHCGINPNKEPVKGLALLSFDSFFVNTGSKKDNRT